MRNLIYLVGAVLLAVPLVRLMGRARHSDMEPVSRHWLAERSRIADDQ